jgi:hypothetical protein
MEHLGVVIPTSAFVNATFDLKQLAALAATSTLWNKFATAKADEILIAEIAARVPFVSRDGLITFNQSYNITETPHIQTLNFSRSKLIQFLDAIAHLSTRKKHQRYPKGFATVLSPDLFVYRGCEDAKSVKHTARFLAQLALDYPGTSDELGQFCIIIAMLIHISVSSRYSNKDVPQADVLRIKTCIKEKLKNVSCHPSIKSAFNKYSKFSESLGAA